ncbi:uncharacterized protein LOC143419053 [Maylandia zebra]|uniref:uncharacterized protein LOC143419053 n=1 Tax=Maylandia zebra TaxID=106582 RepID=UPI00403D0B06
MRIKAKKAAGPDGISSGRQVLRRQTVWGDGAHLQPETGESPTALENLLCCTSAKDSTSKRPQQLQAGGSDIRPDEDPGAAGPESASAPVLKDKLENTGVDHHLTTWILDYLTD